MSAIVAGRALVQGVEVDGVLKSAVLDEGPVGDVLVVPAQAPHEAQAGLCVRVQLLGAELDDVAQAFSGAVLAFDAVVGGFPGETVVLVREATVWAG